MIKNKQDTHKITVELPQTLWDAVRALAEDHQRSFVKELIWALQEYVKHERHARMAHDQDDQE